MKTRKLFRTPPLIVAIYLVAIGAQAQTIQMSGEVFVDKPALPFAPATSAKSPVASTPAPVPDQFIEIQKGKRVDEQLRTYGKRSGWDLIWQAPEYVLDQNMVIQGDFERSVTFFLKGANEAGSRLRATFYRGNKIVRVTEF